MITEELLRVYHPNNGQAISVEDIQKMPFLTDDEIKILAKAYTNKDYPVNYILLKNNEQPKNERPRYPRSSWQNLRDVRMNGGLKNLVAFTYINRFTGPEIREAKLSNAPVQDLTQEERKTAPGLKREPQIVKAFQDANKRITVAENEPIIAELIQSATRDEIEPVEPIGDEDFEELKKEAEEKANKEKVKSKK